MHYMWKASNGKLPHPWGSITNPMSCYSPTYAPHVPRWWGGGESRLPLTDAWSQRTLSATIFWMCYILRQIIYFKIILEPTVIVFFNIIHVFYFIYCELILLFVAFCSKFFSFNLLCIPTSCSCWTNIYISATVDGHIHIIWNANNDMLYHLIDQTIYLTDSDEIYYPWL